MRIHNNGDSSRREEVKIWEERQGQHAAFLPLSIPAGKTQDREKGYRRFRFMFLYISGRVNAKSKSFLHISVCFLFTSTFEPIT